MEGGVYEEQMVLGIELGGGEFGHGSGCELHVYAAEPKISAVKDSSLDILSLQQ